LIDTVSPPSGPVVGPPRSNHSDQRHMQPGLVVSVAVLDNGDVVEAVDRDFEIIGVVYMLVPLGKFGAVCVVGGRVGMIVDKVGIEIMDVIVLAEKRSLVFIVFGNTDVVPDETIVAVGHCVVMLLWFPTQQSTLIS